MNLTCRHVECPSLAVLSYDIPVNVKPSAGTPFHSLHATSQALQPMQTVESVRKAVTGMRSRAVHATTSSRFRFHDPDVRLFRDRDEIVDDVALDEAATAEMIGQADLMDDAAWTAAAACVA